ncbi:MAG TPA: DUF2339 domain-containing protein [Terracidiphilus sp.]|jgi:uncharacterized membrane protein
MDTNHSDSLEEQVGELRSRVRRLEEALVRYGVVVQGAEAPSKHTSPAQTSAPPIAQREAAAAPIAAPSFGYSGPAATEDERPLEIRIGSHWFNRIGILAVLVGMAWFLKLAMDNHWIGPLGRVMIGLIAGAGLIAWSERFRSRGYRFFSYSLKAVGSGTLYLSLWAAFSLYHLIPPGAAFAAMIVVTAFNGFMAWVQDAELLGLYAIAGALSTPILVSTGENHEVTLFTYLLVLNIAMLVLVALRPWSRLLFVSFVGTALLFAGWWSEYYTDAQFGWTTFFLTGFFLLFAFAPRLVRVDLEDGAPHSAWDHLALAVLPVANASLGFLTYYALFDWFKNEWAGAWLAVGFAAFYLLLLRLPARGRLQESTALLSALHLTAAVVFLTIAIPLKAHGRWLTIGWLTEGAALLWVAYRVRLRLLRVLALLCLALGFIALVTVNPTASTTPIFNERFGSYCAGIAVFAFTAWLAMKAKADREAEAAGTRSGTNSGTWPVISAMAVITMNFLILLAVGLEIDNYWWTLRWRGDWHLLHDYEMYAQFTYSVWFMVYGAILLGMGFWRRSAFLRWQALALLAVTIIKVFLFDMNVLSQGYRILSFLGLGALLFAVSYVYQRDWLKLRAGTGEKDEN